MAKQHTEGSIKQKEKRLKDARLEMLFDPSEKLKEEISRLEKSINQYYYGI